MPRAACLRGNMHTTSINNNLKGKKTQVYLGEYQNIGC